MSRATFVFGYVTCLAACTNTTSARSVEPEPPIAPVAPTVTAAPAPAFSAAPSAANVELPSETPNVVEPPPAEPAVRHPFHEALPDAGAYARSPAKRYANLSAASCRAELRKRGLPTKPAPRAAPGVATPVRLTGRLGAVRFITPGERSVYGTLDCRLVLVLSDFAELLAEHHVTAVHVDNFYRPKAHLPGRKWKRSQHAYGLAIDVMAFTLDDGRVLLVERDFHAALGTPPCGPESQPLELTDESIALHDIVCAAARRGLFHHLLTPHYNAEHRDHVHLDIKRDGGPTVIR